jgi:hypothetical protein
MEREAVNIVTTEIKIGKITYILLSGPSDTAKDTLKQKIEKLIIKDLRQNKKTFV